MLALFALHFSFFFQDGGVMLFEVMLVPHPFCTSPKVGSLLGSSGGERGHGTLALWVEVLFSQGWGSRLAILLLLEELF